jgi:hypothetical protein
LKQLLHTPASGQLPGVEATQVYLSLLRSLVQARLGRDFDSHDFLDRFLSSNEWVVFQGVVDLKDVFVGLAIFDSLDGGSIFIGFGSYAASYVVESADPDRFGRMRTQVRDMSDDVNAVEHRFDGYAGSESFAVG